MKIITKNFIFGIAALGSLVQIELFAARTIVNTTRTARTAPVRRRVVYERTDRGGSTARGVFGGAATGAMIGGLAGGGKGAGIGLGVGALTGGLIGSSRDRRRPQYREVIYEYEDPYEEDVESAIEDNIDNNEIEEIEVEE